MKKIFSILILIFVLFSQIPTSAQCNFTGHFLAPVWNCTTQKASVKLRICGGTIPSGEFKLVGTVNGFPMTYYGTVGGPLGPCPKTVNWTNIPVGTFTLKINNTLCSSYTTTVTAPPPAGELSIIPSRSPFLCQGESITLTANGGSNYSWTGGGQAWTGASITVTPSSTTTYVVTGSVASQCGSTWKSKSIPVSVTPLVGQVSTPSGSGARCQGSGTDTYTASATDAGNGYTWTITANESVQPGTITNSGAVTWNSEFSGVATVRVTAYGCNNSTSTASRSVDVGFIPTAFHVSAPLEICSGSTTNVYLTGSQETVSYQLYKNNLDVGGSVPGTGSPIQWTGMTQGTYKVVAFPESLCPSREMANQRTVGTSSPGFVTITPSEPPFLCDGEPITLTASGGSGYIWTSDTEPSWDESGFQITVSPSTTTTYTVEGIEPNCHTTKYKTIEVDVKPTPFAYINPSGSELICSTDQLTIDANTGEGWTYQWFRDNAVLPGETGSSYVAELAGEYKTTITLDECSSTSGELNLVVNIIPDANAGLDQTLVLPHNDITLSGGGMDSDGFINGYQWTQISGPPQTFDGNTQNLYLVDLPIGIYKFQLVVTDDCPDSSNGDEVLVIIDEPENNYNWIKETIVLVKDKLSETDLNSLQITSGEKIVTWNYYDGLGKPMQIVKQESSPLGNDVATPTVYDEYGRDIWHFLPVTVNQTDGYFKPHSDVVDPITAVPTTGIIDKANVNYRGAAANFYSDTRPLTETIFENSPFTRPAKVFGAGSEWKVKNKFVEYQYLTNVHGTTPSLVSEKIVAWELGSNGLPKRIDRVQGVNDQYIELNGYYATGQLFIKAFKDEDQNEVREYSDKQNRLILRKVQVKPITSLDSPAEWALTYYIYDVFGNLRFVLQPNLSANVLQSDTYIPSQTDLNSLAFQYKYDDRHRMIERKVPGVAPVYIVYDKFDRVVMTQDGNQRHDYVGNQPKFEWSFIKYDALNRTVVEGIYTHSQEVDQSGMKAFMDGGSTLNEQYDISGPHGYSNVAKPTVNTHVLKATYYDRHDFVANFAGTSYEYVSADLQGQAAAENSVLGKVTGTRVNKLNPAGLAQSTDYLWTVIYYDHKYQTVQIQKEHHKNGIDRVTNLYDFVRLKEVRTVHNEGVNSYSVHRKFTYDHSGRMKETDHKFHNEPYFVTIRNDMYNEAGQLVKKRLHSRNNSPFSQNIDYSYNIRGWIEYINDPSFPEATDLFSLKLTYNATASHGEAARYNGNISELTWRTAGSDIQSYGYDYDMMGRLLQANYYDVANALNNGHYSELLGDGTPQRTGYDLNGNIKNLIRYGKTGLGTYDAIDDLVYDYTNDDNILTSVADARPDTDFEEFKDGDEDLSEYTYDGNGNMMTDDNKGITGISYNHLNLPVKVSKSTTDYILYTYDATGNKLSQQVFGSNPKTTDYIGEFIYEGGLAFVQHDEGRIVPDNSTGTTVWQYQYHLKDHLGNIRATFNEENSSTEYLATMERIPSSIEADENNKFLNLTNSTRYNFPLFNHTPGLDKTYSCRLSSVDGEIVGPAKSLIVNAGDIVDLEVYAKYRNPQIDAQGADALLTVLTNAFQLSSTGTTPLDGQQALNAFNGLFQLGPYVGRVEDYEYQNAPKAYLNYILFDENFGLQDFGFEQVSTAANQPDEQPVPHELLSLHVRVQQKGYLYIYLSNENRYLGAGNALMDVYFDDFKIVHHTGLEQSNDYYPFGLTFNSYQRENSVEQRWKFQGQEHIDDLGLNWDAFKWRNHQPDIGRFFNIDPLAEKFMYNSPYAFSESKVTNHIELEGLEAVFAQIEGRVSVPLSPILVGATGSASIGIAVNVNDGRGMVFKTTSLGIQAGVYAGAGIEFGALPTGSIDNMKGLGVNAGASLTPAIIAGVPFGPDVGAEVNVTIPTNENGELGKLSDARAGGTIAIPGLNWSAGATGYIDLSNTESLIEFNVNDGVDVLKEQIQGFYEQFQGQFENFDIKYEDFQQGMLEMYNLWRDNQDKGKDADK